MNYLTNLEEFVDTYEYLKQKYKGSLIIFRSEEEDCYETISRDADFFIKYLGSHLIKAVNGVSWTAFPEGALPDFKRKIAKLDSMRLVIVQEIKKKDLEKGFQLSLNFL